MFLLGGEEIGSSGDERSKPFEFFLVRIAPPRKLALRRRLAGCRIAVVVRWE